MNFSIKHFLILTIICLSTNLNGQVISKKQIFQERAKIANLILDGSFNKAVENIKALKKKMLASPKTQADLPYLQNDLILALTASYHSKMISKETLESELKALVGNKITLQSNQIIPDCEFGCCQFGEGENEFIEKIDSDFTKDGDLHYLVKVDDRLVCDKKELAGKQMEFKNAVIQSFEILSAPTPRVLIRLFTKEVFHITPGKIVKPY